MKTINYHLLSILFCLLTVSVFADSLPIEVTGDYFIRLPRSSRYIRNPLSTIPENAIVSINENNNASESFLLLDGHRIKLFPGAVFKISKGSFSPLVGRFEFTSDETASNTINIVANNCNAGYSYGHFLIEVTPDNGVFFALKNKGLAWVKDVSRKVFELRQGQQVQVPLFGPSVLKSRVEAFWGKDPSSFGHLGEIGQETAYGIVGKDSFYSKSKRNSREKLEADNEDGKIESSANEEEIEEDEEDEEDDDVSDSDEIEKDKIDKD